MKLQQKIRQISTKKITTLFLLISLVGLGSNLSAENIKASDKTSDKTSDKKPNSYTGLWLTDDNETIVEISKCKNSLCGRIAGFNNNEYDKNLSEDEEKQGLEDLKIICSMDLLGGLQEQGNQWKKGWVIDFETEKLYSLNLQLVKETLKVRVYKGLVMFGETYLWKRVKDIKVSCDSIIKGEVK